MKALKAIPMIVAFFINIPIWMYLLYSILKAINPDRLVWFLFWIYLPTTFLTSVLVKIIDLNDKK